MWDAPCSSNEYGGYETYGNAKLACSSDKNCSGVFNDLCTEGWEMRANKSDKQFSLCPVASTASPNECTYKKDGFPGKCFIIC